MHPQYTRMAEGSRVREFGEGLNASTRRRCAAPTSSNLARPLRRSRRANQALIPSAPVTDLDLNRDDDEEERERRVMGRAATRM